MNGGIMLYRNGENTVHSTMFYGNYFAGNGNEGVAEVDITRKNKKNPYKKSVRKSVTISSSSDTCPHTTGRLSGFHAELHPDG